MILMSWLLKSYWVTIVQSQLLVEDKCRMNQLLVEDARWSRMNDVVDDAFVLLNEYTQTYNLNIRLID